MNKDITAGEIMLALKSLKKNTSCGVDEITNQMLRASCLVNVEIYVKLFNFILKSSIYPDMWKENLIRPIFKGGSFSDPSNHRGNALSSCFGKFFAKILSCRLAKYLHENNIICNEQIGLEKAAEQATIYLH